MAEAALVLSIKPKQTISDTPVSRHLRPAQASLLASAFAAQNQQKLTVAAALQTE